MVEESQYLLHCYTSNMDFK